MSHEVIQVIKLVKYNRKSHEMIRVTCKRTPTIVNKEIHKNKHSHEMTRFRNRIAVWSSLHKPVLIYGPSYGSVFESPMYRVNCIFHFVELVIGRESGTCLECKSACNRRWQSM